MLTDEQNQIATALHLGCSAVPKERPVSVQAGQVVTVVNALRQETLRADKAEARAAAAEARIVELQDAEPETRVADSDTPVVAPTNE